MILPTASTPCLPLLPFSCVWGSGDDSLCGYKGFAPWCFLGAGHLDDVTITSARPGPGVPVAWVESCSCPVGYEGQFCERCTSGYRRESPGLGPYSPCVPCACNGHSETCDPETGKSKQGAARGWFFFSGLDSEAKLTSLSIAGMCNCRDNTAGTHCEKCSDGYYGDATAGTASDCQPCPCPGTSSCAIVPRTKEVVCTSCQAGTTGVFLHKASFSTST